MTAASFSIATLNKPLTTYYSAIAAYQAQGITHEQATRLAFSTLLDTVSKPVGWTLVLEQSLNNHKRPDGTLWDNFKIPRGYWEAKDTHDDLNKEIKAKIGRKYPLTNIIFEDTQRAVLYQNQHQVLDVDITQRSNLTNLLETFFTHTDAQIEQFDAAVKTFQARIPDLAQGLLSLIQQEQSNNKKFIAAFGKFQTLCRSALNPNIRVSAIEEMLVQHLLTERLFRTIFNNPDFTRRNVIAAEIEKVIDALTSRVFHRADFLQALDPFYKAIENTAETITDFSQKQTFLNTLYERFFQGFSQRQADTHGIVYTPQPIVNWMCASVEEVLKREFGLSFSSPGVKILDPAAGTGNYTVNILRRINHRDLKRKYTEDLFANEVMLLPYYIASLNIEHAYYELMGEYMPFEGIVFADTLDLAQDNQMNMFSEENSERVEREKDAVITVIIGNPPYNVGQLNENDNNKNRKYGVVDKRVQETYAKDSKATLKSALSDVYIKFFRWAIDRLGERDGVVCYISNNSFIDNIAFDGMRKHLAQDFSDIYHFDFKGDARTSGDLRRRQGGNIFDDLIRVGVGITLLVRNKSKRTSKQAATIHYYAVDDYIRSIEKQSYLKSFSNIYSVPWRVMQPDKRNNWLTEGMIDEFEKFLPLGKKEDKGSTPNDIQSIFYSYSGGVKTNRDSWAYNFNKPALAKGMQLLIETYNGEMDRWQRRSSSNANVDEFVLYDDRKIKWSGDLKAALVRSKRAHFDESCIRVSLYRPYNKQFLYFNRLLNNSIYLQHLFFPTLASEQENIAICLTDIGSEKPFMAVVTNVIPELHSAGMGAASTQCFPFYTYNKDSTTRRENITDWVLDQFRAAYGDDVTKRDIFYYIYALLHHPQYRERYAENLKRELPRIPLLGDSTTFATLTQIGAKLSDLHLTYEHAAEYPLRFIENKDVPWTWRVTKMKLSKDKSTLVVNDALTLADIPPSCFNYRLGNRAALEWVIDQYQVTTDTRSGITSDPNQPDNEEYIVRLVGQVVTVSVETVKLVEQLNAISLTIANGAD